MPRFSLSAVLYSSWYRGRWFQNTAAVTTGGKYATLYSRRSVVLRYRYRYRYGCSYSYRYRYRGGEMVSEHCGCYD